MNLNNIKNVLIISPDTKGTIAQLSFNLWYAFVKSGHFAFLLCLNGKATELPEGIHGCVVENTSKGIISKLKTCIRRIKTIKGIIKENNIDATICTLLGSALWMILSNPKEVTKICVFHTNPNQSKFNGLKTHMILSLLYSYVIPRLDYLVAVNLTAKRSIEQKYKRKVELIYNVHNFEKITNMSFEDVEYSDIFNKPTIVYVGHLYPIKGPDRLIKAFAEVNQNKQYSLCLLGEGEMKDSLIRLVAELDLKDSVYFMGYQPNPYKYIARSQLLVSPSIDEGLPGVLIEALSLGKRVVATNSSMGVWEILQCADKYQENLDQILRNELGAIVPNSKTKNNEDCVVDNLAKAITIELEDNKSVQPSNFDKSRFSSLEVVAQYVKIL